MAYKPRRLTVLNFHRPAGAVVPTLHLMGNWLGDAGFLAGCRVLVTVEHERLVVKVTEPPDPEWHRKRLLKSLGL